MSIAKRTLARIAQAAAQKANDDLAELKLKEGVRDFWESLRANMTREIDEFSTKYRYFSETRLNENHFAVLDPIGVKLLEVVFSETEQGIIVNQKPGTSDYTAGTFPKALSFSIANDQILLDGKDAEAAADALLEAAFATYRAA